mmetsp:Transcript_106948/g.312762  ORF Transcript_106948/g.312762 Transcript_106948/m.312762 type:complete len:1388 (+) Transcript_106948:67-4230(+)
MHSLSTGDLVFIPGQEGAFDAGKIVNIVDDATVAVSLDSATGVSDTSRQVARADIRLRFSRDDGSTSQDNTSLVHMNDAAILENLCARHQQDEIYTYTASVLLAVNPYKEIDSLYGNEQCARYRGRHIGALPPHPYAIADTAYRALVRERVNQGLLISGESGAGKTETAKIVMQYLSYASGATSDLASRIQARVLQAQPILESFGNAVTMRNSNSSRFGKYNRVFFNEAGTLVDAGITTYLLESSRVVVHGERERTYHCFYEMLTGLSDERLQELQLSRRGCYRLMSSGGDSVPGLEKRDASNFQRLCDALQTVGLDQEAVDSMMEVLAGLVHLGDIPKDDDVSPVAMERDEDETKCVDVNEDRVEAAARLLGMDAGDLGATLKRKKVAVPGRNSFHEVPRTPAQLRQALHSLIKALYKRLFERTVQRINGSFGELRPSGSVLTQAGDQSTWRHIGILDIYGFERLQRNSFEQLCINLANERLQQYFVENVLVAEQSLYKREGLPWAGLTLPDSQPVVNCITQVFRTLDEYSQLANSRGSASDEQFCLKATNEAAKDPERREVLKQLKPLGGRRASAAPGMLPPALNQGFTIKHYAGIVEYNTKSWLDKNNDRLLPECERLICESTCPLVSAMGEPDQGKASFRSISKRYIQDLEGLLKTLGTCNLHYIRCFKPNEGQRPNAFQPQLLLDQIVQCGTIELVKVMHDGYPNRCSFEEISTRFRSLLPESFQSYGMRTFIEALMLAYDVPEDQWALGMSRLFLRAGQLKALDDMRSEGARPKADKLASIVRGIIRKRWIRAGNAVRLCNYLPNFLQQIYELRARRLAARRRFRSAIRAVQFVRLAAASISEQRKTRLARVLRVAALVERRVRPWLAGARQRLATALAQQREEEERRRHEEEERQRVLREEEERKRLEAELKRMEEERLQREEQLRQEEEQRRILECQREEEERLRREEEERQRIAREEKERQRLEAESKRLEEERLQREEERERQEEEQRRILERQREEEAQRVQEEQDRLREERKNFEEDRKVFEQERKVFEQKKRMCILAQASPQRGKSAGTSLAEELAEAEGSAQGAEGEVKKGVEEDEEVDPGDSASALISSQASTLVPHVIALQVNERIRQLEREMARKQEEVMQQMKALQEKNENLEKTLAEERAQRDVSLLDSNLLPSPSLPIKATPKGILAELTPRSAVCSPAMSTGGLSRPVATGQRERRRSVAQEAFIAMDQDSREGCGPQLTLPDVSNGGGQVQRRWMAEQRENLIEELYPNGSPGGAFARTPARDPWLGIAASTSIEAATPGRGAAAARQEVRNLCTMFEDAEDVDLAGAHPAEAPTPARQGLSQAQRQAAREARKTESSQDCTTRSAAASHYYWNKRGSTGGFGFA